MLVAALRKAAEAAGAEVLAGAEVDGVADRGRLRGGCPHRRRDRSTWPRASSPPTGAWSGAAEWIPSEARPDGSPGQGPDPHPARIRAAGAPCDRVIESERVYLVPRADGRLIAGATVEEMGFDTRITAGGVFEILREAYRAIPEVAELELVETVAGPAPRHPRQRAADRPDRGRRARARHRPLPQRDPAGAADGGRASPSCSRPASCPRRVSAAAPSRLSRPPRIEVAAR